MQKTPFKTMGINGSFTTELVRLPQGYRLQDFSEKNLDARRINVQRSQEKTIQIILVSHDSNT